MGPSARQMAIGATVALAGAGLYAIGGVVLHVIGVVVFAVGLFKMPFIGADSTGLFRELLTAVRWRRSQR